MASVEEEISRLKEQLQSQINANQVLQEQNESLQSRVVLLEQKVNSREDNEYRYNPVLDQENIRKLLYFKPDYVKSLVSNGKILMTDTDADGKTLLAMAAYDGRYDIVQLCINSGADVHHKDQYGRKAIDHARNSASHHCQY